MTPTQTESQRPICDYEGSRYKEEFWGQGYREYEDRAERLALTRLLPARGRRLLEIGAGYGRLADLYAGYDQVVLLDYSRTMLQQARERWGHDPRFLFVVGNVYHLPFLPGRFDTIVMVRVIHHVADVPDAFQQIWTVLAREGRFILEFANKRNLKAILRHALGRQAENPFHPQPYEFAPINFNFHPLWMRRQWESAGLHHDVLLALSYFRVLWLKKHVPANVLARLDGWLQRPGGAYPITPSVMVRLRPGTDALPFTAEPLFRCLACSGALEPGPAGLYCPQCGRSWPPHDGVYDFKGQPTGENF
ncbi:MAG: class I SAM-dependent methyltransferase [Anaerolineae bacterium]